MILLIDMVNPCGLDSLLRSVSVCGCRLYNYDARFEWITINYITDIPIFFVKFYWVVP